MRPRESLAAGNFVPAADLYEDEQELVLKLEVPGIKQEDIDARLENQTLTVKGERKFDVIAWRGHGEVTSVVCFGSEDR